MNSKLKSQLGSFAVTLVLLALSIFVWKKWNWADWVLVGIAVIELFGILFSLSPDENQGGQEQAKTEETKAEENKPEA